MSRSIIIAMNSFRIGGSQTYAATLAKLLNDRGFETTAIAKPGPLARSFADHGQCLEAYWREGMPSDRMSAIKRLGARAGEAVLTRRMKALRPPAAVIASQPFPTAFMADFASKHWPGSRLFGLVHGTGAVEFPPAGGGDTIELVDRWFASTMESRALLVDHGLPVDLLGNIFRGSHFWGEKPVPPASSTGHFRIVFSGTLTPNKIAPLQAAIDALPSVASVELHVLGDGPSRESLMSLAEARGVSSRVRFVGAVTDVRPHLLQASCAIAAGRAAIEAATCGIPVIVATTDGLHGVLTVASYEAARAANFTGRSIVSGENSAARMEAAIEEARRLSREERGVLQETLWSTGSIEPMLKQLG